VGLENTDLFMRTSHNFSWALGIKPHVTLAKGVLSSSISEYIVPLNTFYFEYSKIYGD
jgi:hypothetical protein